MRSVQQAQTVLRRLKVVRGVALADLVLLVILLAASFADNETLVRVFGLIHGIAFMVLLAIVGLGALNKLWSWWFLVAALVTTGPPGAFVGEVILARKAKAFLAQSAGNRPAA